MVSFYPILKNASRSAEVVLLKKDPEKNYYMPIRFTQSTELKETLYTYMSQEIIICKKVTTQYT